MYAHAVHLFTRVSLPRYFQVFTSGHPVVWACRGVIGSTTLQYMPYVRNAKLTACCDLRTGLLRMIVLFSLVRKLVGAMYSRPGFGEVRSSSDSTHRHDGHCQDCNECAEMALSILFRLFVCSCLPLGKEVAYRSRLELGCRPCPFQLRQCGVTCSWSCRAELLQA